MNENVPYVSVVVPVFNAERFIEGNIASLLSQSYLKDRYEIIIVDNGSLDNTSNIAKKYPVKYIEEREVRSSYAARNKGVAAAKGDVIAFTDADCIADKDWITNGVQCLMRSGCDLVGGRVNFILSSKRTAAEIFDSIVHMNNEMNIKKKRGAVTANMITYSEAFKKIGMFKADVVSGGDIEWSNRAIEAGLGIQYCDRAVVDHPARSMSELLRKSYRVGKGSLAIWKGRGYSSSRCVLTFLSWFTPIHSVRLYLELMRGKGVHKRIRIALIYYIVQVSKGFGLISCLARDSVAKFNHMQSHTAG